MMSVETIYTSMDRSDLDRNFGFLIHDVARLMKTAFDRRGRELGLTRSQWYVLTVIYAHEGAPQAELADVMDMERPTLGKLLDRLEDKEWVERRPDPDDRRVKRVYLTDKVQSLMRALRGIAADDRADAIAGIDDAERDRMIETLFKMKSNLLALGQGEDETGARTGTNSALAAADD